MSKMNLLKSLTNEMKEIIKKQEELDIFIEVIRKEIDIVIELGVEDNRELYDLLWTQYMALNNDWDKLKEEFDNKSAIVMAI